MARLLMSGQPHQEPARPLHQCGELLRVIGGSNRYYCPSCDMRKAALANSLAGQVVQRWEEITGHMQAAAEVFEELTDHVALGESHSYLLEDFQNAMAVLWDAAADVDQAISDTRAGVSGQPPPRRGRCRVSIIVTEVFGEGFMP